MRFVLDNSVCMRGLFSDGGAEDLSYASHVLSPLEDDSMGPSHRPYGRWRSPTSFARVEVTELLGEARSAEFTSLLKDMAIEINAATAGHAFDDTLRIARRFNPSAYDVAYPELAPGKELVGNA